MRILMVEDEEKISDAVAHILRKNQFLVDTAADGEEGLILAEKEIYDVIILDIMLPGRSGLDILKAIRQQGNMVPVLLLTARDTVDDRVNGLDSGADDYLVKPFAMAELMARVRALGRRIPAEYMSQELMVGNTKLDPDRLLLTVKDEEINLTYKEAQFLELLMRKPSMVFSKEQIMDRVWGYDNLIQDNNVEIYVHYLRKKMKNASCAIVTIRGVGYTLEEK